MPELPEVETVRQGLSRVLPGQRVHAIEIREPKSFQGDAEATIGYAISDLDRRGKLLHIGFENGWTWLIHLRMTGQFIYVSNSGKERAGGGHPNDALLSHAPTSHTRVIIHLDTGGVLLFNDQRKFGYIKAIRTDELHTDRFLQTLGPEPWSKGFTASYLREICQRRSKSNIKTILLDQKVVAGFGNIYVDEALFRAGIRPTRKAGRISQKALGRLITEGQYVLERGIEFGGVSVSDYVNAEGLRGTMQQQLNVYHRAGQECKVCETEIKKIALSGRGTHFCPSCQH